jgi:large subunit ribosomal protein L18
MKKSPKKLYAQARKRAFQKIIGSAIKPRFSVFRSHKHIYAQLIDDQEGKTLLAFSSLNEAIQEKRQAESLSPKSLAFEVGQIFGQKACDAGFATMVFDRGQKPYHGRIRSLAEGARQTGLRF